MSLFPEDQREISILSTTVASDSIVGLDPLPGNSASTLDTEMSVVVVDTAEDRQGAVVAFFKDDINPVHSASKTNSSNSLVPANENKEIDRPVTQTDNDTSSRPSSTFQFALVVLALCLAIFLVALDNLIISTAIPEITNAFQSLDDVAWYGSSYLFTTCSFQLVFGKAYTFSSPKHVFILAICLFEIGSAVCGSAPSSVALILGRTIAGIGSAGVFSGALIIMASLCPLEKRPIYNAVLNSMYGIASVIGPVIGGVLTDNLSWRWCFYINLPLGGVSVLVIVFALRSEHTTSTKERSQLSWRQKLAFLDIYGTVILIPAIITLLLALQWGGTTYAWSNFRIPLLFTISGLLSAAFACIQFLQPGQNATLPPHILRERTMAAASLFTVTLAGPFFIFIYSVPIWFQAIQSASAVRSGVLIIPLCLGVIVMSLASGVGTSFLGYYAPFFYVSTLLQSVGAGLMTTWNVHTNTAGQVGYQLVYGFGVGFAMNLPFMCASTVLAAEDIAIGTAIITFFQTLSGAIFVAVGQNVYLNRLASSLRRNLPNLDPKLVLHVGATDLKNAVPKQDLDVVRRAYSDALTYMWLICVGLACATALGTVGIGWTNVRMAGKKHDDDDDDDEEEEGGGGGGGRKGGGEKRCIARLKPTELNPTQEE